MGPLRRLVAPHGRERRVSRRHERGERGQALVQVVRGVEGSKAKVGGTASQVLPLQAAPGGHGLHAETEGSRHGQHHGPGTGRRSRRPLFGGWGLSGSQWRRRGEQGRCTRPGSVAPVAGH